MSAFRCKTHDVRLEITERDGREHRAVTKMVGASAGCVLQVGDGMAAATEADLVRMAAEGTGRMVSGARGATQPEEIEQTA